MFRPLAAITVAICMAACAAHRAPPQSEFRLHYDSTQGPLWDPVRVNGVTDGVAGQDAYIEWDAVPAHIRTQDAGHVAFLTFKNPGKYTVTARLIVADHTAQEKSVIFDVKPG